jgi:hypothetical protein
LYRVHLAKIDRKSCHINWMYLSKPLLKFGVVSLST